MVFCFSPTLIFIVVSKKTKCLSFPHFFVVGFCLVLEIQASVYRLFTFNMKIKWIYYSFSLLKVHKHEIISIFFLPKSNPPFVHFRKNFASSRNYICISKLINSATKALFFHVCSMYELVQIYMKKCLLPNRKILCIYRKGKRYKPYWSELPPTNTPISQICPVHTRHII